VECLYNMAWNGGVGGIFYFPVDIIVNGPVVISSLSFYIFLTIYCA
jgi:hypothetical protein